LGCLSLKSRKKDDDATIAANAGPRFDNDNGVGVARFPGGFLGRLNCLACRASGQRPAASGQRRQ
jgi:hypothetical protein